MSLNIYRDMSLNNYRDISLNITEEKTFDLDINVSQSLLKLIRIILTV